jgi:molybdopterin synthase catalytic subunit
MVRADHIGGRVVTALCYEAYPEMAHQEIGRLVAEGKARWSLDAVRVHHRLGLVETGQISVVIAAAARHRAEAYAASTFLIEGIKRQVPIWKRALYEDGTSQWTLCAPELLSLAEPVGAVAHAHL